MFTYLIFIIINAILLHKEFHRTRVSTELLAICVALGGLGTVIILFAWIVEKLGLGKFFT